MSPIAEQGLGEKGIRKRSDQNEESTLPLEWRSSLKEFSGDHPYRRRKL